FATLVRNRADALVVGGDSFLTSRRLQLATLATRHAIPAVYNSREFAEAGGLMSYGTSLTEVYRQLGVYAGISLKVRDCLLNPECIAALIIMAAPDRSGARALASPCRRRPSLPARRSASTAPLWR